MGPLIRRPVLRHGLSLAGVALLLLVACALVAVGPGEGQDAALRQQERVAGDHRHGRGHHPGATRPLSPWRWAITLRTRATRSPTIRSTSGRPAPYNFNGLVRHYFLRRGPNVADIQVNLVAQGGAARSRVTRSPSGSARRSRRSPPATGPGSRSRRCRRARRCCQTLVAEIYGPDYDRQSADRARRCADPVRADTRGGRRRLVRGGGPAPLISSIRPGEGGPARHQRRRRSRRRSRVAERGRQAGLLHAPGSGRTCPIARSRPAAADQRAGIRPPGGRAASCAAPTAPGAPWRDLVAARADAERAAASTTRTCCRWSM